jgi:hypothetical protein
LNSSERPAQVRIRRAGGGGTVNKFYTQDETQEMAVYEAEQAETGAMDAHTRRRGVPAA